MRSILTYADRRAGNEERLQTALAIARAHQGHVTVLVDTPVSRYITMDPLGGSHVATDALREAMADDDAQAAAIEERLAGEDVPFDVVRAEAEPIDALASQARLADLVVVSRDSGLAGELAMVAQTPVLAVPRDASLAVPLTSACVAWDGGDEAARALREAVPLLAGCGSVQVISVVEKAGGFPPTDALRYLSRHGISAQLDVRERRGSVAETLALAVGQSGARLLVMGAFGHSRMREYLFGGVTQHFLDGEDGLALLMAH